MQFKLPKDNEKYSWTNHVKDKMVYYGISESLIRRIVRHPTRVEEGIAPGTSAAMQPTQNKKNPAEVWVMYQRVKKKSDPDNTLGLQPKLRIISAWRYPGISPKRTQIPIPDEMLMEIEKALEE